MVLENAKYMISLMSMVQFFGVLCGTIFYGSLADRYGRKPIAILVLSSGLSSLFSSGGILKINIIHKFRNLSISGISLATFGYSVLGRVGKWWDNCGCLYVCDGASSPSTKNGSQSIHELGNFLYIREFKIN